MEHKQAYEIAQVINEFFKLDFDGRQKSQLTQIILNNINKNNCPSCAAHDDNVVVYAVGEVYCKLCGDAR